MTIDSERLLKYSGLFGLGLIVVGGFLWYREKKTLGLVNGFAGLGLNGSHRYSPGKFSEAPITDQRKSGGMIATTRETSGDMPIEQRIASIQAMIEASATDPKVRQLAFRITKHCKERDGLCEAKAIYKWMRKNVKYSGDISPIKRSNGETEGIDLYQKPAITLFDFQAGDCDDQTAAVASLASAIGLTARLRVTQSQGDDDWSHIYPVVLLDKFNPTYAVAVDTTLPGWNKFGVEYPSVKSMDFDA